jgi:hypothetical protein
MSAAVDRELPGAELVVKGLEDLTNGRATEEALLVSAAAPRLRAVGIGVPSNTLDDPLHRLYELLSASDSVDPHSRYNALIARLVSFARAAERATAG